MSIASIGIFDSGVGGLTVMNEIASLLPYENICYFADTLHLPYGNKTSKEILKYSFESIEFLSTQNIKLLVLACHTSCVTALEPLRSHFPFPIIAISESGIEELTSQKKTDHLAIIATERTIESGVYQKKIREKIPGTQITAIACPLFVPLIEMGHANQEILTDPVIRESLAPLQKQKESIDALLLGCTHYPLLKKPIEKALGNHIRLIDPSLSCAKKVETLLSEMNIKNTDQTLPKHRFFVSDNPLRFQSVGKLFSPHVENCIIHAENSISFSKKT